MIVRLFGVAAVLALLGLLLMVIPWLPPDLSSHISYAKSKQKN